LKSGWNPSTGGIPQKNWACSKQYAWRSRSGTERLLRQRLQLNPWAPPLTALHRTCPTSLMTPSCSRAVSNTSVTRITSSSARSRDISMQLMCSMASGVRPASTGPTPRCQASVPLVQRRRRDRPSPAQAIWRSPSAPRSRQKSRHAARDRSHDPSRTALGSSRQRNSALLQQKRHELLAGNVQHGHHRPILRNLIPNYPIIPNQIGDLSGRGKSRQFSCRLFSF